MIHDFLTPRLAMFPLRNTLFQQDGTTSHSARISINSVIARFSGGIISRNGDGPWLPRSPHLTTCIPVSPPDPVQTTFTLKQKRVFKENTVEGVFYDIKVPAPQRFDTPRDVKRT